MRFFLPLTRFIQFFLGDRNNIKALPERIRNESLATILVLSVPILAIALTIDFLRTTSPFTWALVITLGSVLVSLWALRRGNTTLAVDLSFFGTTSSISAGHLLSIALVPEADYYLPLVVVAYFAAIAVIGLHVKDLSRIVLLLALGIVFDISELFLHESVTRDLVISRIATAFLHILAGTISLFLRDYFDRVHRLAEARRIMNRNLEGILGQLQSESIKKLQSFSHDIRSPITAIMGVQSLLAATKLSAEQKRYLDILTRSNTLLLEIADSVLERQSAEIDTSYPIRRLIDTSLEPFHAALKHKGFTVSIDINGILPSPPLSRANSIRIISNLIDNAIKYSSGGHISIRAYLEKNQHSPSALVLSVSDQGQGMSQERIDQIKTGTMTPDKNNRESRGLGLAGVNALLKDANGEMDIESTPGSGTCIKLRFPLSQAKKKLA